MHFRLGLPNTAESGQLMANGYGRAKLGLVRIGVVVHQNDEGRIWG